MIEAAARRSRDRHVLATDHGPDHSACRALHDGSDTDRRLSTMWRQTPGSGLGPYIYRRTTFRFLSDNPQIAQNRVKSPLERECMSGSREPRMERRFRVR